MIQRKNLNSETVKEPPSCEEMFLTSEWGRMYNLIAKMDAKQSVADVRAWSKLIENSDGIEVRHN